MSVIVTSSLVITGSTFVGAGIITNGLDFYYDPGNINSLLNPNFTTTTPINNLRLGGYSSSLNPTTYVPGSGSIISSSTILTEFDPRNGGTIYISSSAAPSAGAANIIQKGIATNYFSNRTQFTLGIWFQNLNTDFSAGGYGTLFHSLGTQAKYSQFQMWVNSNEGLSFNYSIPDSTTLAGSINSNSPLIKNIWHYYVLTFNNGNIRAYTDNLSPTSSTGTQSYIKYISTSLLNNFLFAGKSAPNKGNMLGYMGPVQIYGRALTQQEVLQNYHTMKGRFGIYD